MPTLTFDEIEARVSAFHARENSPAAQACRAVEQQGARRGFVPPGAPAAPLTQG